MDVNFLAAVVFDCSTRHRRRKGWDPRPTSRERFANQVCVWLDPFWSGLTCSRFGAPSITPTSATAVFHIRGRICPLEPCTLQRITYTWGVPTMTRSLCNSVKLHFFHEAPKPGGEIGRDFLYASAFPLALLLPQLAPSHPEPRSPSAALHEALGGVYGLFNYNNKESSADRIAGLHLVVRSLLSNPQPPLNTVVYAIQGEKRTAAGVFRWII